MIPSLKLWHFLLPGFVLALILRALGTAYFVGIAFDSGGVASGPMTATFILHLLRERPVLYLQLMCY